MNHLKHSFLLFVLMLATASALAQTNTAYVWRNFVGQPGGSGNVDGAGSAARFTKPNSVAVDSAGTMYVADSGNHTIRKVTSSGAVTTLAGSPGSSGSNDGTGSAARFRQPYGVAVDSAGNVFVADTDNNTIRKVTSDGVVTTLAGTAGVSGSADGTNGAARFFFPYAVALDSAGNVYVADTFNYTIRMVTSNGVVTTLAGSARVFGSADGTNSEARFSLPSGVAVDSEDILYVADTGNHTIRKVTTGGVVTTLAGSAGQFGSVDDTGSAARFRQPYGVAADAGNVFVADTGNHTIRQVSKAGVVSTLAGSVGQYGTADGVGSAARFNNPIAVAVTSGGSLYVADFGGQTIREVTGGGEVTTLAGSAAQCGAVDDTGSAARFYNPVGVAVDTAGNVYVADAQNSTIRKSTSGGVVTTLAGSAGISGTADGTGSAARFNWPYGVAVDRAGSVYVSDFQNYTIRKVTSGGVVTTLAGRAGWSGSQNGSGTGARFYYPAGVALDSATNLYVADSANHTIRKLWTASGFVATLAGSAGASGSADGTGSAARFNQPYGVAVDSATNVYVADTLNHTIRKITSSAVVTTVAGSAGNPGSQDGVGSAARFNRPQSIAVDSAGNLFVVDSGNQTIRKVTSAGVVTTIGGCVSVASSADGAGSSAIFAYPSGIAVDSTGRLYVADGGNNRISKGTLVPIITITRSGSGIIALWPSSFTGFALQQNCDACNASGWSASGYAISDDGTNKSITVSSPTGSLFFRLVGN